MVQKDKILTDISSVLDYGQGDDEVILTLFQAFRKFYDAYFELINYGDEWWQNFNQCTYFDEQMKKYWTRIESIDLIGTLDIMKCLMIGIYCDFDRFTDAITEAYLKGETHGTAHEK